MTDPFATTAELGYKGLGTLGESVLKISGLYAQRKQKEEEIERERKQKTAELLATLATKGIYPEGVGEDFELEGIGRFKKPKQFNFEEVVDILNKNQGAGNPLGFTGATFDPTTGDVKLNIGETSEAKKQREIETETTKETERNITKVKRLDIIGNRIKEEWLKTSPYKGLITKTGLTPVLGAWDILKKGLQATSAQQQDQAYKDFIGGIRAQLARAMGDVGNLSEYEQKAVIHLVPTLMDNYETGINKLEKLSALVEDIRNTRKEPQEKSVSTIKEGQTQQYSQENLEYTAKKRGITVQEVKRRLGVK